MRRTAPLIAGLATMALLLGGCATWFQAPSTEQTSTPTGEDVDAALKPFYDQVLVWKSCGDGMQCTTATAPMNWDEPATASIDLALVRQQATSGHKLGSLLVNPGGPGGSGRDFILNSVDYATSETLQQNFDIVGFDPRGVGSSTAISCYDDPAALDQYIYGILPGDIGSDEWLAAYEQTNATFDADCQKYTGPLLQYVDTVSAARDLDLLRAVLGDTKLNYLGYSYGTYLGATYADLYPEKTGRLVLDGAIDPATTEFDVTLEQAKGFESAFRAYLADCIGQSDCPFTGTVDEAVQTVIGIFGQLQASPLVGSDGRQLGVGAMFGAVILPLYNQDNWPYLNQLFTEVEKGQTDTAFLLADSLYGRDSDGSYADNSTEGLIAINCSDYPNVSDLPTLREQADELSAAAPLFGPLQAYGGLTCKHWPYPATRDRTAISAAGSTDIIVIGTTNDPATPYVWAQALAGELENGHLISYTGEGHTAYNKGDDCVDNAVDDYFVKGTVPTEDPHC
jgi:pimeloyl-ACP methyl ester carboxylesterase